MASRWRSGGGSFLRPARSSTEPPSNYKWTALVISTLGMAMSTIDSSITTIALPSIFRGIHIDPLAPKNSFYLLWMILGFLVVTSVLVTSLGRLGDIYGRVRIYNWGFAVFTVFSLLLSITWMSGTIAAWWLIVLRLFQGVGAAMLIANSAAIVTDAFPVHERGMALGINQAAAISGTFLGLVIGGVLATINWHLVFLVSVPIGILGTLWGYRTLRELSERRDAKIDWVGNVTFALGLLAVMIGVTYGIQPYGDQGTGWSNPLVIVSILSGASILALFCVIETRVAEPLFRLSLLRLRAFSAGLVASFFAALARGGLMLMLVIWLQGIWLPEHGYSFDVTPLWAGIAILPLTAGFLLAGPFAGYLSDSYGARPFSSGGMLAAAAGFGALLTLPVDFSYWELGVVLFFLGLSLSSFGSPNRAAIMNALPAADRGVGSGMTTTSQNSAQVLTIGVFFTLMVIGLSHGLPEALRSGLVTHGVSRHQADAVAALPPVATLFCAFLGVDPIKHLLGHHALSSLSSAQRHLLVSRTYFPSIITAPFHNGLHAAVLFMIAASIISSVASWVRGKPDPNVTGIRRRARRDEKSEIVGT